MSKPEAGPPTLPAGTTPEQMDNGLEYFDFRAGKGRAVKGGDRVKVRYHAWLTDGTLVARTPEPLQFVVGEETVIRALEEGVRGMAAGAGRRLIVPSDLAFGPEGNGSTIPPYATLIVDVELLDARPDR
ncbi:MAG: FKBP-type peptidyl-prolyl cis-trans isomerase [Gemmatimonadetes bacterium]|nr:FKBP-type peptidyl-prolyl cis-trans isomerase [Gemmatimonadota bacterium]